MLVYSCCEVATIVAEVRCSNEPEHRIVDAKGDVMTTPYYRECLTRELSQRLKQNAQYSMRAFARSLDVPVSSVSRALAGKRTISVAVAKKIASALNLSPLERTLFFDSIGSARKSPK